MGRYRDKMFSIRLTEDEVELIKQKMEMTGIKNKADFILACVSQTEINVIDPKPIMAVKQELSRIGNNVNQIAKVANTSQSIYYNDVLALKLQMDEIRNSIPSAFDFHVNQQVYPANDNELCTTSGV